MQLSDASQSNIPRVILAALRGGAGKTFLTVGIIAALRKRGLDLGVFKKGPDYIDAGWLGLAAGGLCYNLDAYLFNLEVLLGSFLKRSCRKDAAIVEGNRGLFDGVDAAGSYSTAELAKILKAPVVLIVDATKVTRTAAAQVLGCRLLDPALELKAVILNRVAGARHERILRETIEGATSIPVIGSVNKLSLNNFPQRHFGLLPLQEHPQALEFVEEAAAVAERSVDLDRLLAIAASAEDFPFGAASDLSDCRRSPSSAGLRIGILKDSAFQFYYPENLEALESEGAQLVEISALAPTELPELDGLYIGGGFPETHAEALASNCDLQEFSSPSSGKWSSRVRRVRRLYLSFPQPPDRRKSLPYGWDFSSGHGSAKKTAGPWVHSCGGDRSESLLRGRRGAYRARVPLFSRGRDRRDPKHICFPSVARLRNGRLT